MHRIDLSLRRSIALRVVSLMRVVHLALSGGGGAGIAARRSVAALCASGVDARLWVGDGLSGCAERTLVSTGLYRFRARLDRLALRLYPRRRLFSVWSNNWLPSPLLRALCRERPDVLHCHWIGGGFVPVRQLMKVDCPIVWTHHDCWAFTGGCHYPGPCLRYRTGCGQCPQLGSRINADISRWNRGQRDCLSSAVAAWIFPSRWLSAQACASGLVPAARAHVVRNGMHEPALTLGDRENSRRKLGLPVGALVLACGATDLKEPRKGFALLPGAIARVAQQSGRVCRLVCFGRSDPENARWFSCPVVDLGTLQGSEIATVFQAADLTVLPSLQDNLPNIAIESLACGCPVVGFASGGFPEIIKCGSTGMVAEAFTAEALADAVLEWVRVGGADNAVAQRCRLRFENHFGAEVHAEALTDIYRNVLANHLRV